MILDHCVSLLCTGASGARQAEFTTSVQVLFKLQSGVSAKRIDSLKTALLMIEVIKASQKRVDNAEMFKRFDNFVNYLFSHFSEPVAMAVVKYAIADRRLTLKKLAESQSWSRISFQFKPVLLDNSKDPQEVAKYARYERILRRIQRAKPLSDMMAEYVTHEMH